MTFSIDKNYIIDRGKNMNHYELKKIADKIYLDFTESQKNKIRGEYLSPHTNQVLAFDKYFNNLTDDDIINKINHITKEDLITLRKLINDGIKKYLEENIKTLAIY